MCALYFQPGRVPRAGRVVASGIKWRREGRTERPHNIRYVPSRKQRRLPAKAFQSAGPACHPGAEDDGGKSSTGQRTTRPLTTGPWGQKRKARWFSRSLGTARTRSPSRQCQLFPVGQRGRLRRCLWFPAGTRTGQNQRAERGEQGQHLGGNEPTGNREHEVSEPSERKCWRCEPGPGLSVSSTI